MSANALSDYLEAQLINHIFHASTTYTPAATIYLSLHTADPTDAGLANEVAYTDYARKAITFDAAASRAISQTSDVTFPTCGATGATATHWGIYDALTSGNLLAYGAFSASKTIATGQTPSVAAGETTLTFDTADASTYLANALLDFAFRNQAFSKPSKYFALATAALSDSTTGDTITEPANGYAREAVTDWTISTNQAQNTSQISFDAPTGSWGEITAAAICDALTSGNILFYDNSPTGEGVTPTIADTVVFPALGYTASLD